MSERARKEAQLMALKQVSKAHDDYIEAKQNMRREIELKYEAHLLALQVAESVAANKALAQGVSKSKIGRALGTSNWDTITARLALTAEQFQVATQQPQYEINYETLEGKLNWVEADGVRTDGHLAFTVKEEYPGAGKWEMAWNARAESENPIQVVMLDNPGIFDSINAAITKEKRSK